MQHCPKPHRVLLLALAFIAFAHGIPAFAGTVDNVKRMIVAEAEASDVPASLALAIAKTGANFRPDFKGPNGARGVMQILPETAEGMGVTPAALWQPERNIQLGLKIISHLLERTEGDWAEAVAAYNAQLFKPGSDAAARRVADTLQWERRFAEQLALQDPVDARRREVLAGNDAPSGYGSTAHDTWREDPLPPADQVTIAENHAPEAVEQWSSAPSNTRVEVIVIERVEERPIIVQAPPQVRWLPAPPRARAAPPLRRPAAQRRINREERRYRRWVRRLAGEPRGGRR